MDDYISNQFQGSRSHTIGEHNDYDTADNNSHTTNNNPTMMDWRYTSSMEEVD